MTSPNTALLGPNGKPISSANFAKQSGARKPLIGEIGTPWAGVNRPPTRFPIENALTFDTSNLTLNEYRMMKDNYQISSSLTLLTFILHQLEWKIECDNPKIAKHCEDNLSEIWTRLVRALSQAFWAGFSPNALQWENKNGRTVVTKVKDLPPEECRPHWKEIPGKVGNPSTAGIGGVNAPNNPKVKIFDGIDQTGFGGSAYVPVDNSLWYPLLMENGNMYGRKLLNAAFQPWFLSNLTHMFANRYYERFGEPVIVARAPFDSDVDVAGTGNPDDKVKGNLFMGGLVNMIRNGASVTMPNDQAQNGIDGVGNYEYTIEYLESQMRGADFERMLTRYDQEMSLAMFTPLLMMNTADGGSFNLGVVHTQMYLGMINAIASDWKEYIEKYVLAPMAIVNWGPNAKLPKIVFRPLGKTKEETVRAIVNTITTSGNNGYSVEWDLEEIAQEVGLTVKQGKEITEPAPLPGQGIEGEDDGTGTQRPNAGGTKVDSRTGAGRPERPQRGKGLDKSANLAAKIATRIGGQFTKGFRASDSDGAFRLDIGFRRQLEDVLGDADSANRFSADAALWITEYYSILSESQNISEKEYNAVLHNGIRSQLEEMESGD